MSKIKEDGLWSFVIELIVQLSHHKGRCVSQGNLADQIAYPALAVEHSRQGFGELDGVKGNWVAVVVIGLESGRQVWHRGGGDIVERVGQRDSVENSLRATFT